MDPGGPGGSKGQSPPFPPFLVRLKKQGNEESSRADPEKKERGRGGGGGGGGEGGLDWDKSYLASMKDCLRFEEETCTPRHCLLGAEQALQHMNMLRYCSYQ